MTATDGWETLNTTITAVQRLLNTPWGNPRLKVTTLAGTFNTSADSHVAFVIDERWIDGDVVLEVDRSSEIRTARRR